MLKESSEYFDVLNDPAWLYNCTNMLYKSYNHTDRIAEKINYNICLATHRPFQRKMNKKLLSPHFREKNPV